MEKKHLRVGHGLLLGALMLPALAQAENSAALVRHGQYLVERVGMCADCHSPRLPNGQYDRSRWLAGADIDFKPTHPVPGWEDHAPRLAGLPHHWTAAQTRHYLMTGLTPKGHHTKPPMPDVRLSGRDASAVVAYLASLKK